jgi:hypothetical protein
MAAGDPGGRRLRGLTIPKGAEAPCRPGRSSRPRSRRRDRGRTARGRASIRSRRIPLDAKTCATAIRGHWGIENRNHHVRDRTLGEDASRIRRRPGMIARPRSFALNILRGHGAGNVSEALYTNALSLDRLLAYGRPKSQN